MNLVIQLASDICHLDGVKGRVLFNMLFVGIMSLTNKGCRTVNDFPFDKLSGCAQRRDERGWLRRAIRKPPGTQNKCVLQATVWMDRKCVGFLHSAKVSMSAGFTVV
jgi:hypothetical protein